MRSLSEDRAACSKTSSRGEGEMALAAGATVGEVAVDPGEPAPEPRSLPEL